MGTIMGDDDDRAENLEDCMYGASERHVMEQSIVREDGK